MLLLLTRAWSVGCTWSAQVGNSLFYLDSLDSAAWLDQVALPAAADATGPVSGSEPAGAALPSRPPPVRVIQTKAIYEDYERNIARIARSVADLCSRATVADDH